MYEASTVSDMNKTGKKKTLIAIIRMTITRQHEIHDRYRPNGTPRIAFTNVVGHYPHIQKIYILYTTTNRYFIHHTY